MKLRIAHDAAAAAAFVAAAARIFVGLALDSVPIHNGVWIAALLGALPAIPYLLCLEAVQAEAQPNRPAYRMLMLLLASVALLDASEVLSVVAKTSEYLTINHVPLTVLTVPVALAALWCICRNGDAVGYAAMLWIRVFPVLLMLVLLLQLPHLHVRWLQPRLGDGWRAIANGGVRTAGWFVPSTAILFVSDRGGALPAKHVSRAWLACAALVTAPLLALRLMMAPTVVRNASWLFNLDALLTNGRAPLYLQLPMILIWFVGLLHLLSCDCFAATALLQRLFPAIDGRACAALVVLGTALLSIHDFSVALNRSAAPWVFILAASIVGLYVLVLRDSKGGEHR